jgi:hypothetical protein
MASTIEQLEQRLRALEDIAAIKDLKARYLRSCDLQRPDDVRDCLLPEAVIAYEGFPQFNDRDSFVDIYRQMGCQPGIFDMHHGVNPEITLTGADSAKGIWSLFFQNINLGNRTVTQFGVEYDDDYVRRDGRWWIARSASRKTSVLVQMIGGDGVPKVQALGRSEEEPA